MGNSFLHSLNKSKNFVTKEIKKIVGEYGPTPKTPTFVTYSRTYMGNYNMSNLGVLPTTINTQVQSLINQGIAYHSIFYPTLVNYGLAGDIIKNSGSVTGTVQSPGMVNEGFLSKITLYVDSSSGVKGILQYFGGKPGSYIGVYGSYEEVNFVIPFGDYLTQVEVLYTKNTGGVAAIRFLTQSSRDSGWIGHTAASGAFLCNYMSLNPVNTTATAPQEISCRPIYCLDGWALSDGSNLTLGARFTNPYIVTATVDNIQTQTDATGSPIIVNDVWSRTWQYTNSSSMNQETSLSDTITNSSSHTLSTTSSKSTTTTNSFSISAMAVFEGGMVDGNFNHTQTTTRTTSTTDSTTLTSSSEQYFSYPLLVAPMTKTLATVHVYQTISTANITVTVNWYVNGSSTPTPTSIVLYYSGMNDYEIVVNVQATPLA